MARVVVVGAGLSGLAAAARLARLKHDVLVCERASGPGGQAGRYERDGFAFDTGPTTLLMPASYRDLFVKTGKTTPIENYLELRPIEPAVRWRFEDGTVLDVPNASRAGTVDVVAEAFGHDAAMAWDEFLRCGDGVWERFRKGFHDGPPILSGRRFRVPAEEKSTLDALNPARTYGDLMDRYLKRFPPLRRVAASWPIRLGSDPEQTTAGAVLWPWLEQTFGVWAPVGGVRALVDVVAARAESRGATLRFDTEVHGLRIAGGRVVGVELADEVLAADVVVAAVDDGQLAAWTEIESPTRRSRPTTTVLLALDDATPNEPLQQLVFPSAPGDSVLVVSAAGTAGYTVTVTGETDADAVVVALDRAGLDVSRRLRWQETRRGEPGLAGPALHGRTGLVRPPNATGVEGLFHVGASAHPGPGIAFAPLGAALVADAVGRAR